MLLTKSVILMTFSKMLRRTSMDQAVVESLLMPVTYGRHLVRLFDTEKLLAGTGLRAADLDDPEGRISVKQALQYVSNTIALADDPAWYLRWARNLADHFHGPTSIALASAPTLGDGVDTFLHYFPSRIPYMHMQGRREADTFHAELWPLIDLMEAKSLLVETPLIILQQHLETVYGVNFKHARLELDYPPTPYADRYRDYFKCPVVFDTAHNALLFPMEWRELKNMGYIESTWDHALAQCRATMASSRARETLGEIRAYLCRAFEDTERNRPLPKLDEVAEQLHLTPRTLIRRLRDLGTTYQEITDDFLRARADELLANDELTVKAVAARLGFDNAANFGKMFKRWHGVSPGVYRNRWRDRRSSN